MKKVKHYLKAFVYIPAGFVGGLLFFGALALKYGITNTEKAETALKKAVDKFKVKE